MTGYVFMLVEYETPLESVAFLPPSPTGGRLGYNFRQFRDCYFSFFQAAGLAKIMLNDVEDNLKLHSFLHLL